MLVPELPAPHPLRHAIGPSGVAGDPRAICYVALRMSEIYKSVLEWGLSWRGIECDWPESHGFIALMPEFINSIASAIERLPADIEGQVRAARNYYGETPATFRVTLVLEIPDDIQRRLHREMDRMSGAPRTAGKSRRQMRWWLLMLVLFIAMVRSCGTEPGMTSSGTSDGRGTVDLLGM